MTVMQKAEYLERISYEFIEDCALDNVKYVEVRFAPVQHGDQGLTFDEIVESVLRGLAKGKEDFGTESNLILCAMRHLPVEKSVELVEMAEKFLNKGVVAIDLAGNEHDFPPEIHQKAFDLAHKMGFKITIHAGETGLPENITKSVELLHADRIGHGVFAYKNEAVVKALIEKGTVLEVCPTSNVQTMAVKSVADHPVKDYFDQKINITMNTDNRTVSNTTMTKEYDLVEDGLGFTEKEFMEIYETSIAASFASDPVKEWLKTFI